MRGKSWKHWSSGKSAHHRGHRGAQGKPRCPPVLGTFLADGPHWPASEGASLFLRIAVFQRTFCRFVFSSASALSFRAERKSWGSPKHKASIDRRSVEAGEPQLRQIYSLRAWDGIPCAWSRSRVMRSTQGTVSEGPEEGSIDGDQGGCELVPLLSAVYLLTTETERQLIPNDC
jgi:hypothetical protein